MPTVFLSVAVSCFLLVSYEYFIYTPCSNLSGTSAVAKFTLTEYPTYNDGRYYCMSRYKNENGKSYKVRLSLPSVMNTDFDFDKKIESCEPGDVLTFSAYIYSFGGENEEIKKSYMSKGLYLGAYPKGGITVSKAESFSLLDFFKREKKRTVNLLLSSFDGVTASMGISLLMGDKNLLDNGTYEAVKNAGVSHFLAVSGFHLSLWIMLVIKIIEILGLSKRKWAAALLLFDLLVMFFASFSGSVLRAGFMMALWLLGMVINEECDSLNSLGFSAAVILFVNPFSAMNISFLLSFVACYCIITVAVPVINMVDKKVRKITYNMFLSEFISLFLSAGVISAVVSVYTLPLTAYYFGTVSLVSVITNILLAPVATPLIVSFGLYVMLWFVPVLSDFLYGSSFILTRYMLFCVNLTGTGKNSVASVRTDSFVTILIIMLLLFALPYAAELYKREKKIKSLFKKSNT